MRVRRFLFPGAVLMAAIGIGLAQLELPAPDAPPLANDIVSSLVTGEFSGNTHMDAVVLANGKPVLRESVETYQTYLQSSLLAVDMAKLKGTGADGRDQLVAVGAGGLTLLELLDVVNPPGSDPWSPTNPPVGPYWTSAIAVRTGQVDGLNGDDIVAVTPTRVVILPSAFGGGWLNDMSFVAGTNITGVELVDWDGLPGGALEIAVLIGTNAGGPARIRIVRPNGTLMQTINSTGDVIIASPLATSADGPRWLAAVSTKATGAQDLVVMSQSTVAGPWSLGAAGVGVYDSVAADWDGDDVDDLVLATNTTREAGLYRMHLDGPMQLTIDTTQTPINSPILLPVGHPDRNVSVQDGRMDVVDIDHDGDVDLVTAVQGNYQSTTWNYDDSRFSTVSATRNLNVDQRDYMPWLSPWPEGLPEPELILETGILTVQLVRPDQVLEHEEFDAVFEYGVWRTLRIETLAIPTPLLLGTMEIAPPDPEPDPQPGVPPYSTLTLPLDQHEPLFADRYTLVVRQVVRDDENVILKESPAVMVTFFSNLNKEDFEIDWNIESKFALNIELPPDDGGGVTGPSVPATPLNQHP